MVWYDELVSVVVVLAALLLLALAIYTALRRESTAEAPENTPPADGYATLIDRRYPGDATFDALFEKHIAPHTDRYFYTSLAGASLLNGDGSPRPSIIEKCEPLEQLRLELEPNNPADPDAIAVKRIDGSQLGYLERKAASDLHQAAGNPVSWSAIFKHANRHPRTEEIVGAVIVLTMSRIDPDQM
jgi:HIRAN domain